jgi:hypothetical protein
LAASTAWLLSALQSKEPVGAGRRTHGNRHQADVRFGQRRWTERHLYEVELTSGCRWAISLLRRLLTCRANWQYRRAFICRGHADGLGQRCAAADKRSPKAVIGRASRQ